MATDTLVDALAALEKSRIAALNSAISARAYRLCAALDDSGQVQKGIDRCRRMLNGKGEAAPEPTKSSKKK
jgi:hypothetical protein